MKETTTGGVGGLFGKMVHFYRFKQDEFLKHYHKRSNVESTFSMVKGKFGDAIRSKSPTSKVNEILCKILCHNVCCLIQSHYELGIAPLFWGEQEKAMEEARAAEAAAVEDMEAWAWV